MNTKKLLQILLLLFLFLLPWQTRYIYEPAFIDQTFWEYGSKSLYATELLLWVIILVAAWDSLGKKSFWRANFITPVWQSRKKYFWWTVASLGFFGFLGFISSNSNLSWYQLFHLLEAVCIAAIIVGATVEKTKLITAFWLGAVVQALLAISQFSLQTVAANKWLGLASQTAGRLGAAVIEVDGERWLRAYGSFGSPNILGAYLVLALLFGCVLLSAERNKIKTKLFFIGQMFIWVGILLSFSRAAWLSATLGLIIIFFQTRKVNREKYFLFRKLIAAFFILTVLMVTPLFGLFNTRASSQGRLESRSNNERVQQYSSAAKLFSKHIIFGVGPGTYSQNILTKIPSGRGSHWEPVHNTYVLIAVELGLIGFLALIYIWWQLAAHSVAVSPEYLPVIAGMAAMAFVDHFWWTMFTGVVLVWVIFALILNKNSTSNLSTKSGVAGS